VHDQLVAEGETRHYTKRFQNKLLSLKKDHLVEKIEKSVAEKIYAIHKELEDLKDNKVKGRRHHGGDDDFDDSW
jgi:hypothetical protein